MIERVVKCYGMENTVFSLHRDGRPIINVWAESREDDSFVLNNIAI